jgi:hypothetical protein
VSTPFDPHGAHIVVDADLEGPAGMTTARVALDTGASQTVVDAGVLATVGCVPGPAAPIIEITTGSAVEHLPQVRLTSLEALGQTRPGFDVLAHTLPPSAGIDGVLGLDFLRGHVLKIDFQTGQIDLT